MAEGKGHENKDDDTMEMPVVTGDPVLGHLRQAETQYEHFRRQWAQQGMQLQEARSEVAQLVGTSASLESSLRVRDDEIERQTHKLNEAQSQLADMKQAVKQAEQQLEESRRLREDERLAAQRYRERASQLANSLKDIHTALFEGGVYSLILKACLAITGGTRGLYITTRGDVDNLRIRAAQDIDGYPASPPSEFIKALCQSVLENNDSVVCNSEGEMEDMPRPERPGEHFQNLIATPVVLMRNLNGILVVADKLNGSFNEEDIETLLSVGDQASVAIQNRNLQQELQNSYVATVSMLADAVEAKDPYTHGHCDLVSRYARLTAEKLDLSNEDRSVVCYAALLHDVGKIGVSDGVLNKPGPLLPEERDLMRAHVRVGHDLLAKVPALNLVAEVVLHHHEWYDGSGYPDGIKGKDIPIAARIVCVVDAYCAMITKRSYKEAYSVDRARDELVRCSGSQFDPDVVEAFLTILDTPEALNVDDDEDAGCGVLPSFVNINMSRWQQPVA